MEEADMLLDRPPGGWDARVTKSSYEHTLPVQTWLIVGALGVFMGVFSGVVAFIIKP